MVEINLGSVSDAPRYSENTLGLAMLALEGDRVKLITPLSASAASFTGPALWHPTASLDDRGRIVGVTCTCPNGKKGGVRARCWHAAALEYLIDGG